MPILDHFSLLAPIYDLVLSGADKQRLEALLRLPSAGMLLDVGGGTGRASQVLAGLVEQVVVLDESRGMLEQARAKGLHTVQAHAEEIPFDDGSFDRILIVDAIHHVADVPRVLAEFCRLLRSPDPGRGQPGGRLVIEEPDIAHWRAKFIALAERLFLMRSRFYRAEELVSFMADCQVETQIVREKGMFWVIAQKV